MTVYGFPYGSEGIEPIKHKSKFIQIAVSHEYVWVPGHSYPNAPKEQRLKGGSTKGYDIIVYGDNHKGFEYAIGGTDIFNCGTLMRRKSDEIDYKPQVGLLLKTGEIKPHYLDISEDKYLDLQTTSGAGNSLNMKDFIKELEKLGDTDLDFTEAMKQYLEKNEIKIEICNIIRKAMGL